MINILIRLILSAVLEHTNHLYLDIKCLIMVIKKHSFFCSKKYHEALGFASNTSWFQTAQNKFIF